VSDWHFCVATSIAAEPADAAYTPVAGYFVCTIFSWNYADGQPGSIVNEMIREDAI